MTSQHQTDSINDSPRPLWAPWRIQYIRGPKDDDCFICAAAQEGDGDDKLVIARGEKNLIILNAFPYNSGHLLICPYRHVGDLAELDPEELHEIMTLTIRVKALMTRIMAPDGFNFGFNLGHAAGAGLESHIHGHLVPRWTGDVNFMPVLANTRVVPEALEETAELLRKEWQKEEAKR